MHLPIGRLHDVFDAGAARAAEQSEDLFLFGCARSSALDVLALTGLAARGRRFFTPRGCWLGLASCAGFDLSIWAIGILGAPV